MGPEQNAVITGASSEIGGAIATAIASTGASVCLAGRNAARLKATANKLSATARTVKVYEADLTVNSAVEELVRRLRHKFEAIDVLVHCAGAFTKEKIESTRVQELDALFRTNVRLPFIFDSESVAAPQIAAWADRIHKLFTRIGGRSTTSLFASTQHALKAFADGLRQEVNAEGIRVLSVYPGRTATARMKALYKAEGRKYQPTLLLQPEDIAQIVIAALQLPRTAEVTNLEIRPLIKSY